MEIKTYSYPDGEILRVQIVRLDSWAQLEFLRPTPTPQALHKFADIYRRYLVPACPWLFGNMVLFRLPEDVEIPLGGFADREIAAAALLRKGVTILGKTPAFHSAAAKELCK